MSSFVTPASCDADRPPITKAGLQLLAARYTTGQYEAHAWGQTHLLNEFWGVEPENATIITPLATSFAPLLAQLICAISAGGLTPAWVLRIVLTPEFLWMGLHQTPFCLMEVGDVSPVDICRHYPLVAGGSIAANLSFDESWVSQCTAMDMHLRVDPPALYHIAVGTGHPEDINMDRVLTPVTSTFPEPLAAPPTTPPPHHPQSQSENGGVKIPGRWRSRKTRGRELVPV
ncbi:hypothetical protein N7486_009833 [Penicillium sp. IBT 16267x]|nr:hypothetical protein N7486_009833 [Penicillium sp. IBT 16267x]